MVQVIGELLGYPLHSLIPSEKRSQSTSLQEVLARYTLGTHAATGRLLSRGSVAGCAPQHHPSCNHVAQLQRLLVQQQQVGVAPARNLQRNKAATSASEPRHQGFCLTPYHMLFRFRGSTHIAAGGGTHGAGPTPQLIMPGN